MIFLVNITEIRFQVVLYSFKWSGLYNIGAQNTNNISEIISS